MKATSDSAITCHLQESEDCRHLDRRKDFKVIARARQSQHLDVLEVLHIKNISPELCQQKHFASSSHEFGLSLFDAAIYVDVF